MEMGWGMGTGVSGTYLDSVCKYSGESQQN